MRYRRQKAKLGISADEKQAESQRLRAKKGGKHQKSFEAIHYTFPFNLTCVAMARCSILTWLILSYVSIVKSKRQPAWRADFCHIWVWKLRSERLLESVIANR
jgi:hypothetical protein